MRERVGSNDAMAELGLSCNCLRQEEHTVRGRSPELAARSMDKIDVTARFEAMVTAYAVSVIDLA